MSRYIDILNRGKETLNKARINDYKTDSWLLFEEAFSMDRATYFMRQLDECNDDRAEQIFNQMIKVRCTHVPLQHITGHQEFMGLDFKVNEHTLIPRQDTECLVEEALQYINQLQKDRAYDKSKIRILDMCTGSGCIAISVAKLTDVKADMDSGNKIQREVKTESGISITGVDISPKALKVAEINRSGHKAENVTFIQSNLFDFCGDKPDNKWDIIVSNPPYISTMEIEELEDEVKLHDPRLALDGMEDGLYFYREITARASEYLNNGGYLLYEIGHSQGQEVSEIMKKNGFTDIKVVKDMAGLDRVVTGKLNH